MKRTELLIALTATALLAACGGDKTTADEDGKKPESAVPITDFRKQQEKFADSVLSHTEVSSKVVEKLGKGYQVGSLRLRDSVALLARDAGCFVRARETDPYLAGTVTFWVNMSVIGSDLIQVQEPNSKWTSQAGNLVVACLNQAARKWKFNDSFGKPGGYIVQVQFRTDTTDVATKAENAAAPKAGGAKKKS